MIAAAKAERAVPPLFDPPTPLHVAVMEGHPSSGLSIVVLLHPSTTLYYCTLVLLHPSTTAP